MRREIDTRSKFLAGAVEATEGVNPNSLVLIRTRNLTVTPYDGETITREYDGDSGRNRPKVKVNEHTTFAFDVDFAGSGNPATIPAVDAFLRMAGLSRAPNATAGFDYLISDAADVDSGTLLMRRIAGAGAMAGKTSYVPYEANGVKGYVGISLSKGKDPLFQFKDMRGSYLRPVAGDANTVVLEYLDQTDPEVFQNGNTPIFRFGIPQAGGGFEMRNLCAHSFSADNYSGFEVSRSNAVNCPGTRLQAKPIEFKAQIGWDDSFFELVESHKGIIRVPLLIQHGSSAGNTLSLVAQEIQISDMSETDLDDGTLGMDLGGTFLDKPVLTIA